MARFEIRDAIIRLKDGLSGTSSIQEATPTTVDTDVDIENTVLNTSVPNKVPIGARFTHPGAATVYTVQSRVQSAGVDEVQDLSASGATAGTFDITFTINGYTSNPILVAGLSWDAAPAAIQTAVDIALAVVTGYIAGDVAVTGAGTADLNPTTFTFSGTSVDARNQGLMTVDGTGLTGGGTEAITVTTEGSQADETINITFTPAWGTPAPSFGDTLTFESNQVEIKIGDGNVTWTTNKDYEYLLDRGNLDTVREGDQQPVDVTIDSVYESITTGTGETVSPYDAFNGIGGAAEWVSSSSDPCEPYSVDVEIEQNQPCGTAEDETTLFPDFRYDTLEVDLDAATISTTGRANVTLPTVTRQ